MLSFPFVNLQKREFSKSPDPILNVYLQQSWKWLLLDKVLRGKVHTLVLERVITKVLGSSHAARNRRGWATLYWGKKRNPAIVGQHRLSDAQYIANSRKGVVFRHSECLTGVFVALVIHVRKHSEILRRFSDLAGSSDQDSEFSVTIRGYKFPDQLSNC